MKRIFTVLAAAAMFGAPATGEAKTLEEILRDKGVITDADYQEALKKNDLAWYRPGRGITLESRDGNNVAHIGGRLQTRFTFTDFDDSTKDDLSTFNIQRLRVSMRGNVYNKNLFYAWQHDFGGRGGATLKDAIVGYRFTPAFTLQVGQFKAPQARQQHISSGSQLFVDRSLADDTFSLGRDRGIQASGEVADGLFQYAAGLFNGNGENRDNVGTDHLLALRVDLNPLGKVSLDEAAFSEKKPLLNIGASYARQTMSQGESVNSRMTTRVLNLANTTFGDELDWWLASTNVHFRYLGLTAAAEYYLANVDPQLGADYDADGYYVQAGYQIVPEKLEVALRYSAIESTDTGALRTFDKSETQVGVNYYYKKHNAKISADYTMVKDDLLADRDDNIFRLQAQLIF